MTPGWLRARHPLELHAGKVDTVVTMPAASVASAARLCTCLAALALPFALGIPAAGRQPRPPRPPENARVLTDLDGAAIRSEMRLWAAALGVACDHCHVQGNFASDEKRPKRLARGMLEMTQSLNARHFPDYQAPAGASVLGRVTCFTCHQGARQPPTAPPQ